MKCWICKRQARGFGHSDRRHPIGSAARYPIDWAFCSRRCQDAFHRLYSNWVRVESGLMDVAEVEMIDPSDVELAAMRECLKSFGRAADAIGFDKPLGSYSEAEALRVIDAIVTGYTDAMLEHHTQARFPPVLGASPAPDPMAKPYDDLKDDPLWDEPKGAKR